MQISLCKKSTDRLPGGTAALVDALRARDDAPSIIVRDCLDRCQRCDLGFVTATVDGIPLSVKDAAALIADIDALAD